MGCISKMHPERDVSVMNETCGIHAGYMRHSCILRGNQDACWIHAEYMRDSCKIHSGYVSGISRGIIFAILKKRGLKGMYRCHYRVCSAPMTYQATHLFLVCCSGSSPAPCSTSIFCFVMATPKAEARAAAARAAATGRARRKEPSKPAKKQKGGKGAAVAAVAPKAPAKAPKASKDAPKASPQRSSKRGHK
jgi:hypothetical protein